MSPHCLGAWRDYQPTATTPRRKTHALYSAHTHASTKCDVLLSSAPVYACVWLRRRITGISALSLFPSHPIIHFSPSQGPVRSFFTLANNCLLSGFLTTMNEIGESDRTNDMTCLSGTPGKGPVSLLMVPPPTAGWSPQLGTKLPTEPSCAGPTWDLPPSPATDNGRFIKQIMGLISAPCVSDPSSVSNRRRVVWHTSSRLHNDPFLRQLRSSSRGSRLVHQCCSF